MDVQTLCEKASAKFKRVNSVKIKEVQDAITVAGDVVIDAIRAGMQIKIDVMTKAFKNMADYLQNEHVYSEIATSV